MKRYRDLSVKVKVPVWMGIASLLVLALVCLLLMIPLRSSSLKDSSKIAQLSAVEAGNHLAEKINGVATVVRAYSGVIELLVESDIIPKEKKREWLLAEMKMMMKKEKQLRNFWCTLEPNALDGMDSLFINQMGSNSQGIFAPWFADGEMIASEDGYGIDYYSIPKATGREMITEPYLEEVKGKQIQMFSIAVPVMLNGKFIGVVGTNFYTNELNELILSLNRNTSGKLVTDKGTIAVHRYPERIGTQAEFGNQEILDKLPEGKMFEGIYQFEGKEIYKVYNPIRLGENNNPWFYAVDVPREEVYAHAHQTAGYLIVYCLIGVVMIALSGGIVIRSILKDVTGVTELIRKLSLGHINLQINGHQNQDEIGKMKTELSKLIGGLKHTADFAHCIGEGDLNAEYRLLSNDDVLGNSLLEMRQSLQKAEKEQTKRAKEEEQRNWGTAGLAKFAEILRRDNDNLESLSYNVISNMVKYLDANQGGIFILNDTESEEDKVLEMKACYAFDRKKFSEKEIHPGEGLVGTCYLEGETIYITEVPDNYITITSGLGDSNPRAVLICPLKINDEILGVIELASFQEIEPYQLEFVQKVSESIAATISAVRVNIRTDRLLSQTKLQAEEMANQEEELRQNMEEMQATQEETRRRDEDVQKTLEGLSKTQVSANAFAEKVNFYESTLDAPPDTMIFVADMDKKITFMNRACLNMLGKTKEEITGKYCYDIFNIELCKTDRCAIDCLKKSGISSRIEFGMGDMRLVTHASFVKGLEGNNIGYAEVIENITDFRRNETKLEETLKKVQNSEVQMEEKINFYESTLDAPPDTMIFVADMDKKITYMNRACLNMLGKKKEEIIGKYCYDIFNVELCKTERCAIECLKKCGKSTRIEFGMGDMRLVTHASFVKDLKGNNIGYAEVIENITERKNS
jgi:PAS domain S-box-containing protein